MNLKELARRLDLSTTTVSRALGGYSEVNEATRSRVIEAAALYNYKPNNRARYLATGRAMAVAEVIPLSHRSEIVNPIYSDFMVGAGEVFSQNGYDITLSIVADEGEEDTYRELAGQRPADGVILHSPKVDDTRIDLLRTLGLPFVVHGRAGSDADHDSYTWVDVNNHNSFLRATNLLLDLGHSAIALVNGDETVNFAHRRRLGFQDALAGRSLSANPDFMVSGEMTLGAGYRAAGCLLARTPRPTAILSSSVMLTLGIERAAVEAGLTLGRDLSLVTFDDKLSYADNGGDTPYFTAVGSSVREAGVRTAQLLLHRIETPAAPHQNTLLESQLVIGRSTGPAPR